MHNCANIVHAILLATYKTYVQSHRCVPVGPSIVAAMARAIVSVSVSFASFFLTIGVF